MEEKNYKFPDLQRLKRIAEDYANGRTPIIKQEERLQGFMRQDGRGSKNYNAKKTEIEGG